ncbi:uncharacterized protein LOC104691606 isoform X3 [Corvus cornix cornix]|uniref:uncharacterized protein LOC116440563 isoform X3 n=1 Tax=Corvus moneduloides TaxID=1196302 RepID=UPI0013636D7D|nr:uncharacterized protein LOC116440563 isoform X3 [Corvus moneduloides]XP_031957327.1 uncharacterized protein LOC116440563 isoform X3 [Corvus moneduloides]XP_039424756.1 uncharacterized protein LOC104691606 isoform X3 [Corvus cornix cornix]XP_039424757.1 uncharacterized protein LOC104691606 isoform X3 [Corvus cornix cornix]XP_048153279.1 uncharacterized protein LOC125322922 isoform X4 [Corvus hawaiiensis]XP_048153280.1 uncharacterized protein LOC125322922 isoform X4 [Corvus hawaiiensis]XP_04
MHPRSSATTEGETRLHSPHLSLREITAHLTQWRLPIRSRRGCHATYLGGRLAQPAFTGAMPKRKAPVPLWARGALRAGSERAALPPRRRRRGCSALRPAAGSVHCSSAGPRPESRGSGSQQGHPAPAPLNTAGQVRRKIEKNDQRCGTFPSEEIVNEK